MCGDNTALLKNDVSELQVVRTHIELSESKLLL